jgi:hypothetical protein
MKFRGTLRSALAALVTALIAAVGLVAPVQVANAVDCSNRRGNDPVFVEGTIKVGETVKASPMTWGPGVTLTYRWTDGRTVVQEGPSDSFVVPANMENKWLRLQVVGSKAGCEDWFDDSDAFDVAPATGAQFFGRVFTGSFVVGQTIRPEFLELDISPIARCQMRLTINYWQSWQDCSTFTIEPQHAGLTLQVQQYRHTADYQKQHFKNSSYKISSIVGPRNMPSMAGVFVSGKTLTAFGGTQPAGSNVTYEWCRVGLAVAPPGACFVVGTGATYTQQEGDVGNRLYLRAKYTESNGEVFWANSLVSPPVKAAPAFEIPLPKLVNRYGSAAAPLTNFYNTDWLMTVDGAAPTDPIVTSTRLFICPSNSDCATRTLNTYVPKTVGVQHNLRYQVITSSGDIYWSTSFATDALAEATFPDHTVAVSGTNTTFKTLTATPPFADLSYPAGMTWEYQWQRSGTAIPGQTSSTYNTQIEDIGKTIRVAVTVRLTGYTTRTFLSLSRSIAASVLTPTPTPTISGTAAQGSTLTVVPGTWDAAAELSYSWSVGGTASGTDPTLLVEPAMAGKTITVTVTGSKPGYTTVSKNSVATAAVPFLDFALSPTPTIEGAPSVGVTMTALLGEWDPGVSFAYQWLSNTTAISGATGPSWVFTSDHIGKRISVKVTASKVGYNGVVRTSAQTVAGYAGLNPTPVPTITGELLEGETLSSELGIWAEGVGISYQWLRNGSPVAGEIDSTYQLTKADVGAKISLRVTGSKAGYLSVSKTSVESSPVIGLLSPPSASTIEGTMAVGKVVSVTTNGWGTGHTFTYQWYRNSAEIVGATERLYVIDIADLNAGLSVRVTASKPGYQSLSVLSAERGPVTPGTLTAPTPSFTGTVAVGKVLTARTGTWSIGTTLTYQWLRAGRPIAGANKPTYKLSALDKKKAISLRVTGSKVGYNLVAKVSAARNVP